MELFISWIFSIGQSEREGRGGDLATVDTLATSTTHAIFLVTTSSGKSLNPSSNIQTMFNVEDFPLFLF